MMTLAQVEHALTLAANNLDSLGNAKMAGQLNKVIASTRES